MLIIGMTIPVYISTVWSLFSQCNITGPLKILIIFSLLVTLNAFIVFMNGTYNFMASLNLNDYTPTVISNALFWFSLAAIDNIISIKKIGAVYSHILSDKLLYVAMSVITLFSSVEFVVYLVVLSDNSFLTKKMVASSEYLLFLKPWMLVHFFITFALNTASLSILYFGAEIKSLKQMFQVQYVNTFQIRIVDLLISVIFMSISIVCKGIQFSTGFLPIDIFVDSFLLVWLLHIHLSQLSVQIQSLNQRSVITSSGALSPVSPIDPPSPVSPVSPAGFPLSISP